MALFPTRWSLVGNQAISITSFTQRLDHTHYTYLEMVQQRPDQPSMGDYQYVGSGVLETERQLPGLAVLGEDAAFCLHKQETTGGSVAENI